MNKKKVIDRLRITVFDDRTKQKIDQICTDNLSDLRKFTKRLRRKIG